MLEFKNSSSGPQVKDFGDWSYRVFTLLEPFPWIKTRVLL